MTMAGGIVENFSRLKVLGKMAAGRHISMVYMFPFKALDLKWFRGMILFVLKGGGVQKITCAIKKCQPRIQNINSNMPFL